MRVAIIGAGPAGLFAAWELAPAHDVAVIERLDYVGGSGLHSDGKLNFHPAIGGDLTEFLPQSEAWDLVDAVRDVLVDLGAPEPSYDERKLGMLEALAARSGLRFIKIKQSHIGSDHLGEVIAGMRGRLESKGVQFSFREEAEAIRVESGRVVGVETSRGHQPADAVLLAPGRSGSAWLTNVARGLGIEMKYNPIDVGVRVEVPAEVMDEVITDYGCWDPKFHINAPGYDDFVRTFCVSPRGFVMKEEYGDDIFGVNGHSMRDKGSWNTNFALLVRMSLTHPLENTTEYGRRIAEITNTLGGRMPIIQRLGDLRGRRRSTWDRLGRSYVEPTLREVTPGDISMAYPLRVVTDLLEGLAMLGRVMPGIDSDSTLLYAPEIKFYAMRIVTDRRLMTAVKNLYVAGDGAGVSRGIVGAAATGVVAARGISKGLSR